MHFKIKKAMVLAAGYGTRLRPLSDQMPKPLISVAGKPMLEYALEKLKEYGVQEVIINVSHLKEQLIDYLSAYQGLTITISEEAEPLETGGGVKKALPLLGAEPFFTINSDIIWIDEQQRALDRLARFWNERPMDFLLLTQPKARTLGYETGQDHLFIKPANTFEWNENEAPYVFASLGVTHAGAFRNSPEGKFSVKILWQQALAANRLWCVPHLGRWFQAGTNENLKKTEDCLNASHK